VGEIVANWGDKNRASLARACEHSRMKEASKRARKAPFQNVDPQHVSDLRAVARAFMELQEQRHLADYDYLKKWSRDDVLIHLDVVTKAFRSWRTIRDETIAHDYLMSCLVSRD
jgi:hypothetical protein